MLLLLGLLSLLGNVYTAPVGDVSLFKSAHSEFEVEEENRRMEKICIAERVVDDFANDTIQDKLNELLIEGFKQKGENMDKMSKLFNSNSVKICIPMSYTVYNCTEDECHCLIPAKVIKWSSVNTETPSGRALYWFAYINWNAVGFEWGSVCDTEETLFFIHANLAILDAGEKEIIELIPKSLENLAIQVSCYIYIVIWTEIRSDHCTCKSMAWTM